MKRVLLVDKSKEDKDLVYEILKNFKLGLTQVADIKSMQSKLARMDYELILIDVNVALDAGLAAIAEMKRLSQTVPILILTSDNNLAHINENYGECTCDIILRPLSDAQLTIKIKHLLELKRILQERDKLIGQLKEYQDTLEILVKEKSESLEESMLNYYTVVEQTQEGVVIVQEGKIVFTNSRFSKIIDHDAKNVLNKDISKFFPPEIEEMVVKKKKKAKIKPSPEYFESSILTKKGRIIPIDVNLQETVFHRTPSIIIFIRDITERKKLQSQIIHDQYVISHFVTFLISL